MAEVRSESLRRYKEDRTRTKILQSFGASSDGFVSGGELAKRLQVSRTAIWKQIVALRELGYVVEAAPRKGYRLLERPDRLFPWELQARLRTEVFGYEIEYHEQIGSTNERARRLAREGAAEGTLVVAEEQLAGRGRRGRGWVSPFGEGIFASLVLRPPISPFEAPKLTLLAAVAVCRSIGAVCGVEAGLKWPNDVLVQGKKVCGILVEMGAELDTVNYVVIGSGVNANLRVENLPPDVQATAGSLRELTGRSVDRTALLAEYLRVLERLYKQGLTDSFQTLLGEVRHVSTTLGQFVRVHTMDGVWEGKAVEIDDSGALVVVDSAGIAHRLHSGEVSVRHNE